MFGWFKRKPKPPTEQEKLARVLAAAEEAVSAYGALMEQYPAAILDSSELPLPKGNMKAALKIAWLATNDDRIRNFIEVGYVHLSNFQDGVGDTPIDLNLRPDTRPGEVPDALGPYLAWADKMMAEGAELLAEIRDFKAKASRDEPSR